MTRLQEAHREQKLNEKNDPLEFIFGDLLDTFAAGETVVLAALAHFTEPARLEWLLPLAALSETAALTALDALRDRALLIEDDAAGTWLLPPLAARFLRQRNPEAVGAAGERLAEKAYALAVQHGYVDNAPFTELEIAWPTMRAALPLLVAGDNSRLQTVCNALADFLNFSGRWDDWLALSPDAETKALASGDRRTAGWRAYQAGGIHLRRGDANAALACAERCSAYWEQAQVDAGGRQAAISLRGHGLQLRKDYATAISAFQQALDLARSLNPESVNVAVGLNDLAIARRLSGDLNGAETDYRESLRIASKVGDAECIAISTGNLADFFLERGDWPAVERQASEALELAHALGRQELIATNHLRLATAMLRQQRAAQALPHAEEAAAIYTRLRYLDLAGAQATVAECKAACAAS